MSARIWYFGVAPRDRSLLAAIGRADAQVTMQLRNSIVSIDATLGAIDNRLAREFPEYAKLAAPKPLSIGDVQVHLKSDEALVLFLDIPRIGKLPEESLAWAVTKTDARWVRIDLGTAASAGSGSGLALRAQCRCLVERSLP